VQILLQIKPKRESSIVWFRQDLRTIDQPALSAAIKRGGPIVPVYIWEPKECGNWPLGAASKWWLHHSLISLERELIQLGLQLIVRKGSSIKNLLEIAAESQANAIYWNRCYEPYSQARDSHIQAHLQNEGLSIHSFNGSLLYEPWKILNKQNKPFQVFTPFWKHCLKTAQPEASLTTTASAKGLSKKIRTESIHSLDLLPHVQWDIGLKESWQPGCSGAQKKLQRALEFAIPSYVPNRAMNTKSGWILRK